MFKNIKFWAKTGPFSVIVSSVLSVLFVVTIVQAATTIGSNIQTDGTLAVTGTSTFSATTTVSGIGFANGWSLASTTATTSEITVYDSGHNSVLVFDEN